MFNKSRILKLTVFTLAILLIAPAFSGCNGSLTPDTTIPTETITITDTTTETITITNTTTYSVSTDAINEIEVSPAVGNYLRDTHDEPLEVMLINVQVEQSISDEEYFPAWYPGNKVDVGESILVVSGTIRNEHPANTWISMFADGYDGEEEQVAWTLDQAHVAGQILRYLDYGETGEFTIHLNPAENIETIRIFADSYNVPPP